jgi:peptidyl-prolyl cis-trans isomerase C
MRCDERILLALGAAAMLGGCAPDADVLARVGTRTIRQEDFVAAAQALAHRYPGPPDSAKIWLLHDMVDREVLVQGAFRAGLHRDTTFLDFSRRVEEQTMRQAYYEQLGTTEVAVSEDEIAELHRWRTEERWVRLVMTPSEESAKAALAEIRRGAKFEAVADRFNPPGQTSPGGDLGYVAPGNLPLPLDEVIRTAPIGKVLGPISSPGEGWFLVWVQERRKSQPQPLELERGLLISLLRQRKQRAILLREVDHLTAAYQIQLVPGAGQNLIGRIMPYVTRGAEPPPLGLAESAVPLVRYEGGVFTMGDAFEDLGGASVQRPNLNMLPSVERWLEFRTLERVTLVEARRRQFADDPQVRRAVRERLYDYLLQGYVEREVASRAAVTEEDVRASFVRAGMAPTRLERARFLVVVLRDSATAAQLAATARQAGGLREAVATAALGVPVRSETVRFPTDTRWAALEGPFSAIAPGEYTPPIHVLTGWMVAQLLTKSAAPLSFESLPPELRNMLESDAQNRKRADLMTALSDSLRRMIPVAIYPARLRRVPWPLAAPPTQG